MTDYDLYINGKYVSGTGKRIPVINPTTGEMTGTLSDATAEEVAQAVTAADEAFRGAWSSLALSERGRMLHRLADAIEDRAEDLAIAEVQDNGKVYREMIAQLKAVPRWYRYFGGLADKLHGQTVSMDKESLFTYTLKEPLGVIGCITPWNSPILLGAWKFAPALAAGNTIVVKPSEHASVGTVELAKCFEEAGFPPGVFNVVTGEGVTAGAALVDHPLVSKVSFTGSGAAGQHIASRASARLAEVGLELGGKSPNILFSDCNKDAAISGILAGIFAAAGQTCVAGSRAIVHRDIYDEVVERLLERTQTIRMGDPLDPETEIGPIANLPQLEKVKEYVEIAQAEGATLLTGGKAVDSQGYFYRPTIFGDVKPDMRIVREEVFGPVLTIMPFETDDEAIELANDTDYGLAAGLWTNDVSRSHYVSRRLKAGTVWVNTYRAIAHNMPFGGYKKSGLGRENGIEAINDFLRTKSVWVETEPSTGDPFALKV
ncbi:aldehyde dehydrogenase [Nesterenkonia ebinurensis]|uniref:aldehyde dehydrogenase n=1 Tax=Nesterenkonia ebinurensis TaxID=2608252 RepID=UPI00123DEF58|nr:aldehyde dehydrogenase [Nesterenkonia ebinurensis]